MFGVTTFDEHDSDDENQGHGAGFAPQYVSYSLVGAALPGQVLSFLTDFLIVLIHETVFHSFIILKYEEDMMLRTSIASLSSFQKLFVLHYIDLILSMAMQNILFKRIFVV